MKMFLMVGQETLDLISRPIEELADLELTECQRGEIERQAELLAQEAVFLAAYMSARGGAGLGDSGHEEALRFAQKRLKAVRKAMGYVQP